MLFVEFLSRNGRLLYLMTIWVRVRYPHVVLYNKLGATSLDHRS